MELIYTTRAQGFEKGKHYRNPRYFDRPEQGVKSVVIEGDFPAIKAAYEDAGVKTEVLDSDKKEAMKPEAKPKAKKSEKPEAK